MRFEYTVACPRCLAPKTKACVSAGGNWAEPHAERSSIVIEAWRLGYADGIEAWAGVLSKVEHTSAGLQSDADFIRSDVRKRVEAS